MPAPSRAHKARGRLAFSTGPDADTSGRSRALGRWCPLPLTCSHLQRHQPPALPTRFQIFYFYSLKASINGSHPLGARLDPLPNFLDIWYSVNPLFTGITWDIVSDGMYEITPAHQPSSPFIVQQRTRLARRLTPSSLVLQPHDFFEQVFLTRKGIFRIRKYWCWLKLQYSFRYPNISFLCKLGWL